MISTSRFQSQSIRYQFKAYGRTPRPVRRLGGRPHTASVALQRIPQPAFKELTNADLTAELASRILRTAIRNSLPDFDKANTPRSVQFALRTLGFAWRGIVVGIVVAAIAGMLSINFLMLMAVVTLGWVTIAGIGGAVHAYFHMRANALQLGTIWLATTAVRAARSTKTGPSRLLLRWATQRPKPWFAAACLHGSPMVALATIGCFTCGFLATWVCVTFDVVWLPTASSE